MKDEQSAAALMFNRDAVGVVIVNYVHKKGLSIRSFAVPGASPTLYTDAIVEHGMACCAEHAQPLMWVFNGHWPNRNKVFTYVTANPFEVAALLNNPKQLRVVGMMVASTLVPLDPQTHDAKLSLVEHNDWIAALMGGTDQSVMWNDITSDTDFTSLEDFLQEQSPDTPEIGEK